MRFYDEPSTRRERDVITRQVAHLFRLVDDLLDVSRIVRGIVELHPQPTNLALAVDKAIQDTRSLYEQRGVTLERTVQTCWVHADPVRLAQIISNLLTNGAKFTVVGYGATLQFPPPRIFYDDTRRYGVSEFRTLLPAWLRMSQQGRTGDQGTCYGDSGGPTFWEEGRARTLVATTSWGDAQCVTSEFNYRVDLPESLEFIYSVLNVYDNISMPRSRRLSKITSA